MNLTVSLVTLLHILVFVYWLGGDLGAFFASYTLIDESKPVEVRLFALKVVNNVDMAPRTGLILALPTGLLLASIKGWLVLSDAALTLTWIAAAGWLVLVWRIHLKHLPLTAIERRIDIAVRWILVVGLVATGLARLSGHAEEVPLFIALKCLLLASAIVAGLLVRRTLGPLFEAVRAMSLHGPTAAGDAVIRRVLTRRSKPAVMMIWIFILAAALCGIAKPM